MNWRLDNPPVMDVSVSRHMGLFAVARLAERHRIRIRLRPASPQGLTALVWLPDSVIERTARTFTGTGSWQPPVTQSGGFLQPKRASGVHSIACAAASQRSSGRHGIVRAEDSTATQPGRCHRAGAHQHGDVELVPQPAHSAGRPVADAGQRRRQREWRRLRQRQRR